MESSRGFEVSRPRFRGFEAEGIAKTLQRHVVPVVNSIRSFGIEGSLLLRGSEVLRPGFEVSRFRGFEVSRFRGFEVSRFRGFKVSRLRGFEVSRFRGRGFEVSRFRGCELSRLRGSEVSRF